MFIQPMLLEEVQQPFNDSQMIGELKLDGMRLLFSTIDGQHELYSRHGNNFSRVFPEIRSLDLPEGLILDGELIITDEEGKPDFERLKSRINLRNEDKIRLRSQLSPTVFCVFDILFYEGKSVMDWPLLKRKELLERVIDECDRLVLVRYVDGGSCSMLFDQVKQLGLEGCVFKNVDSRYVNQRSYSWLKLINYQYDDVVISGYREKQKDWLIGKVENGMYRSYGTLELGLGTKVRKHLHEKTRQGAVTCKVKFRGYTKNGYMRLPAFQGLVS